MLSGKMFLLALNEGRAEIMRISIRSVEHHCHQNMKPGTHSPFNSIIDYQRYASALAFSEARPPTTTISSDGSRVTYRDSTLEVPKWLSGLRKLFNDTKRMISEFCGNQILDIKIPDNVQDDMTECKRGYSWLDNGHFIKNRAVMQILMADQDICLCQRGRDGLIFNMAAMHVLMEQAANINDNLSILCHALPGQPSRGSEFVECKIRNSTRPRNLFRNHGSLWFVTRRVKYESLIRKEVFIPIKIPPELQELLEIYLLGIRPVEIDLARQLYGTEVATLYHEYLYVQHGQKIDESRFSQTLHMISRDYFGCGMRIRAYRHIVVAIARTYLGSEYEIDEDEDDALAEQSGHSGSTRRLHYAPEHGKLPALSSDIILRFGTVSEWWWRLVQFYPGAPPLLPLDQRRRIRAQWQSGSIEPVTHAAQQQISNAPSINPGEVLEQITAAVNNSVAQLQLQLDARVQASVAAAMTEFMSRYLHIHPLTNHPSQSHLILPPSPSQHAAQEPIMEDDDSIEDMYLNDMPQQQAPLPSKALQLLSRLFPDNPDVSFRSEEQHQMVTLSLSRERSFVAILPTGGGKSLVFLLPALEEINKYTLVIIPNKALLDDMLRKSQEAGIHACQWLARNHNVGEANLIFLALESVTSPTFKG